MGVSQNKRSNTGEALREVVESIGEFTRSFELVFDNDWDFTLTMLRLDPHELGFYITPDGTFLNPGVQDESNNWANRGALLYAYRGLLRALENAQRTLQAQGEVEA